MDNGLLLRLQNMDAAFEALDKRLLKFEEPNHKEKIGGQLLQGVVEVLNNDKILKKEKINRLKNEINTTKSKISDLQRIQKCCSKDMRKDLQRKQELEKTTAQIEEELANLLSSKKKLEQEVESAQELLKKKFNAHDRANKIFQTQLQSYIQVDDPVGPAITMFLLDTEQTDSYFVKLQNKENTWSLLQMEPALDNQRDLAKKLHESNDVQGFLSSVRKQFKKLKMMAN